MVLLACQRESLVLLVHGDVAAAGYAAGPHTAGDHCRMGGHAAADCQDALGSLHSGDILGRGLQAHQNHLLASCMPAFCILRREYDFAAGSAG